MKRVAQLERPNEVSEEGFKRSREIGDLWIAGSGARGRETGSRSLPFPGFWDLSSSPPPSIDFERERKHYNISALLVRLCCGKGAKRTQPPGTFRPAGRVLYREGDMGCGGASLRCNMNRSWGWLYINIYIAIYKYIYLGGASGCLRQAKQRRKSFASVFGKLRKFCIAIISVCKWDSKYLFSFLFPGPIKRGRSKRRGL